ncbi:MAG: high frequency lysogenization protein HflD [Lysobacteraceae bacterium]
MKDRALALAGLLQSVQQVRRIATTGDAQTDRMAPVIDSLFRIDAETTEDVYGGVAGLEPGLRLLYEAASSGEQRDPSITRVAATLLHVERRFNRQPAVQRAVHSGILDIQRQREHWGPTHPTVLGRLGELYGGTVSKLRPRVLVHGNPTYLGQPTVVAEIRAVLLAGLRSAVLWRQLGGGYLDLMFRRKALVGACRDWLERI